VFGESEWNAATSEMSMPVRLVNTSSTTIVEALTVRVSVVPLEQRLRTFFGDDTQVLPRLVHPSSGVVADVVTFTYPVSPRAPLFPNGSSVALTWRVRLPSAAWIDSPLSATVSGSGC
jgi:hypothetical protein